MKGSVKGVNAGWTGNKSFSTIGGQSIHGNGMYGASGVVTSDTQEYYSGQYDNQFGTQSGQFGVGNGINIDNRYLTQDATFLQNWQTNGRYINQVMFYRKKKLGCLRVERSTNVGESGRIKCVQMCTSFIL